MHVLADMPCADLSAALSIAAARGRGKEVQRVLDKHFMQRDAREALHHAFERGAADVGETRGEALSRAGRAAAAHGNDDVLRLLLACDGMDLNGLDDVLLAACCADFATSSEDAHEEACERRRRCVKRLLERGADANGARSRQGWKPLMACAKRGDVKTLDALLDAGADVDARYFNGKSALYVACEWGQTECAKALIKRGASLEDGRWEADHLYTDHSKANELVSPRDVAARLSHEEVVRVIDEALRLAK